MVWFQGFSSCFFLVKLSDIKIMKFCFVFCLCLFLLISLGCTKRVADAVSAKDFNTGSGIKPISQKRDYWPTQNWRLKSPEKAEINTRALKELEDYLFTLVGKDFDRRGIRTDGLVIIKNGYLVYEKYARNYHKDAKHLVWSVTKSFVNALYGVAVREKYLKLSDSAYRYYSALDRPKARRITIKHVLEQSSGINWEETYEFAPLTSSVVAMLYTAGRKDMAYFTGSRHIDVTPGKVWEYSSGNTNLLMGILKNILKEQYIDYPWKKLFNVIGMHNVTWEKDASGTYVGASYIYAPPRELAKFGFLYLNDGIWNKQRILPEGWVEYSGKLIESFYEWPNSFNRIKKKKATPGAHWWGNHAVSKKNAKLRSFPGFPHDMLVALGHWGQSIVVIPSLDVVAVRTADDRDKSYYAAYIEKLYKVVKN